VKAEEVEARNGVTVQDRKTGEFYCIFVENGQTRTEKGKCDVGIQNANLTNEEPNNNQEPRTKFQEPNKNQEPRTNNQTQEENIETQLISHPEKETTSTNAIFEFSSNIEGATFQCQINKQGWQPCESPKEYVNLTPGEYTFRVYSVSPNGEYDTTPEEFTWRILLPNEEVAAESNTQDQESIIEEPQHTSEPQKKNKDIQDKQIQEEYRLEDSQNQEKGVSLQQNPQENQPKEQQEESQNQVHTQQKETGNQQEDQQQNEKQEQSTQENQNQPQNSDKIEKTQQQDTDTQTT